MKQNPLRQIFCSLFLALLSTGIGAAQSKNTEIWDFGGVAAEEKSATNHITVQDIDQFTGIGSDGKFTAGDWISGDLTLRADTNDRAYYAGKKNYGTQGYASFDFGDGYISNGLYYCNGKGGETKRYVLLNNVRAGDVITFYARLSNSGDEKIHLASVLSDGTKDGKQDESAPITAVSQKYSYIATVSGSYKIYTEANVGKPCYYRVVRIPGIVITGTLTNLPSGTAGLKFIEKETHQELQAEITGTTYTASLAAGHTYSAVLTGIKGYGISAESKIITLDTAAAEKITKNIIISEQKTYKLSGTITGIDPAYDGSRIKITMNPPANSLFEPSELTVTVSNGAYSYRGELTPNVSYTATLAGAADYEITAQNQFDYTSDAVQNITVSLKPVYAVSGTFFGMIDPLPSNISFRNIADGYTYAGTCTNNAWSAKLRDGVYEVTAVTAKAATMNHIVVKGCPVVKNIKLTPTDKTILSIPLKKDLYVDVKKGEYPTVTAALIAAAAMNPQSENDRITIHIAPGIYRAQLIITTPYITLKNDTPGQEVKLTWYYGIAYNYYSADKDGYYNEDRAYDSYEKKGVSKWGAATYVKDGAKYFRAEGITFETSFNKYVTDEELTDGVEMDGSLNFQRKINSDVRSKKATERSAALCSDADQAEYYNCRFLGVQDTLYTGTNKRQYFRNCYIEGNTDFIFGDGDVVFENCEIRWAGYTDSAVPGYLTAARTPLVKGYLFYNCLISADAAVYQAPGMLGRPWGPQASVTWINTILGFSSVIDPSGWTSMSGNQPEKASFKEYNSQWNNQNADTSKRTTGTVLATADEYTPAAYLNGWIPSYAVSSSETPNGKVKFSKKPSFTTDDDINTPYPGHTITVHYSLGKDDSEDNSLIQWYRITKDGTALLVKQSAGYGDKSYLINKEDTGATIKATVTPKLRNGSTGKAAEVKLDAQVNEGYAVPSKGNSSATRVVGKVNIFLASDSTVKDYSSAGMWNAGQTRNEGSWGEFLPYYLASSVAVQNYANGGRSSRNFINEGSLELIAKNIAKGDYLFIQFGHNDCSNQSGYLEDRFVPLGEPDKKGIYPVTPGIKVPTPASYTGKYGPMFYSYNCGGTYKWYLKQYIDVAKNAGAIPVLVTPVSRVYFDQTGKIRPHHDSTDTTTNTQVTHNNAYVEAVQQLAKEEKVILIDGFESTKALYEQSFADTKSGDEAKAIMFEGGGTHANKLGGFILAGVIAGQIKNTIPALAPSIVHPAKVIGENSNGSTLFTVNSDGKITCTDAYWQSYTQNLMDSLLKK
jgi:pectin methylesterase-like acyl-CoA thioesterase/lysophospholipase L1-like esterase